MSSSRREGEHLSARLTRLRSSGAGARHIWDIGCDHGLLGLSFYDDPVNSIHFVDPSSAVIEKLTLQLAKNASYITEDRLFIHHCEGQNLKINTRENKIFIAGMGGDEIGSIISALLPQLEVSSHFVISPHRKLLELRNLLVTLKVTLLHEEVIFEDGQFYPILVLGPGSGPQVHPYGQKIWEGGTGAAYLEQQIHHFGIHRDKASQAYVGYLKELKSLKN